MTKSLKTVKASIVMGILLISVLVAFMPSSSAGPLKVNGLLRVEFNADDIEQEVIPASGFITIGLKIFYQYYGVGASWIAEQSLLKDIPAQVDLTLVGEPEWCTATITTPVLTLDAGATFSDPAASAIIINVNENAPAFIQGKVKISAHSSKVSGLLFSIEEQTLEVEVPFQVGYSPAISFTTPKGNFIEIGPLDTAEFEIEIENLGNAQTEVSCEILNAPEGWSPNIVSAVLLDSKVLGKEDTTKTVHFKVKPPYGFGYHNEMQSFQVKLTPYYYRNPSLVGKDYIINFNIQSRGFSTPGFEIPLIALALISTALVYKMKKKKQ